MRSSKWGWRRNEDREARRDSQSSSIAYHSWVVEKTIQRGAKKGMIRTSFLFKELCSSEVSTYSLRNWPDIWSQTLRYVLVYCSARSQVQLIPRRAWIGSQETTLGGERENSHILNEPPITTLLISPQRNDSSALDWSFSLDMFETDSRRYSHPMKPFSRYLFPAIPSTHASTRSSNPL